MRASWFLILVFSFTAGVFFRSFVDLSYYFSLFLLFVATVLFFYFILRKEKIVFFVSLSIISFALGISRYDIADRAQTNPTLDANVGENVTLLGMVSEEPDERIGRTNLTVDIIEIQIDEKIVHVNTRAQITVERYPQYSYGEWIQISGKLLKPKNFKNEETGKIFDYVSYLAKDGIFYQILRPSVTLLTLYEIHERNLGGGNRIKRGLLKIKHKFLSNVSGVIPEPESSLLGGLLLGAKQSLGKELLDDFRIVGVIHIVVLSGYNLTIVADAITRFFSFAPRLWGISLGGISIVLFSIMTGAGATVVRASIMALLALVARATGRVYEITLALLLAGFVMLLYNPKILIFDPSFQLSFLATLGLIHFSPIINKFLEWAPKTLGVRDIISATLATQLTVLPLLIFMTGTISLVSLPANLLILPLVPLTMLFGFFTGLAGFAGTIISLPFAFIAHMFLWLELKVVELAVLVPYSSLSGFNVGVFSMVLMYILILYVIWILARSKKA